MDEAGRGPLAGPVVAAAVILPARGVPRGLNDSKKLPAGERARLSALLHARAGVGIGVVEPQEIDLLNIHWATMKAMTLAVEALGAEPGHVLVDGNRLPRWRYLATAIVGGDGASLSIAAASIVAKHHRDTVMIAHAAAHPHYGWHSNKGYGCAVHLAALREHGPTPLHRFSFAPVAQAHAARTVVGGLSLSSHTQPVAGEQGDPTQHLAECRSVPHR